MVSYFYFLTHIDEYLILALDKYGLLTYLILFMVIFIETGLVVAPFLPGDSLIFIVGAVVASSSLHFIFAFLILSIAAILGDSFNYLVGKKIGKKLSNSEFIRKDYLLRTERFYEKHGGKTIIYARFFPIIRTFAPFLAGIAEMEYSRFLAFNVIGAVSWVTLFLSMGYFFGNISIIQNNLTIIVWIIIGASLIPPVYEYLKHKLKKTEI